MFLQAAAGRGVDAVFFLREGGVFYDPLVLVAALAELQLPIGLGGSVAVDASEPFHIARSFAAIDRLTAGQSALVIETDGRPGTSRRLELFDVVGKLLDSWEDGAVLVDRAGGLFTDPARIHRIDHDGPHYVVRGPLNAPRPLQGAPVIVAQAAQDPELAAAVADVVLVDAAQAGTVAARIAACGRARTSVRILASVDDVAAGFPDCDGINIRLSALDLGAVPERPTRPGGTLRARLGLARQASRYAA